MRKAYQIFNLLGPGGTRLTSVCVLVHSCGGNGGFREPGTLQRVPLPWLLPLESGKQEGKEALAGGRSDPHKESRGPSPLQGGGGWGYVVVPCSQEEGHLCRGSTHGVSAMRGRCVYEGVESTLGVGRREGWRGESGNYSLNRGLKRVRNGSQERSQWSALSSDDRSWWMQTRRLEMHFRTGLFLAVRQCRAVCMGQCGGTGGQETKSTVFFLFSPSSCGSGSAGSSL